MAFDPAAFAANQPQPEREKKAPRSTGFDPTAFIGDLSAAPQLRTYEPTAEGVAETAALGAGGAAATAYGFSGRAISPGMAYDAMGRPILQSAGQKFQQYVANPLTAGRDIAASKVAPGMVPAQVVRGALPEMAQQIDNILGQLPKGTDVNADQFLRGLSPQDQQRFVQQVETDGLERAFKNFKAPAYMDEAGQTALRGVQQAFPSGMSKLGTAAGLLGRTAARFAGPVGIGMAAYDLYELGQYGYDQYQRSKQAAPPPTAPVAPATGAVDFETDRRIREEAARRALQGQQ
jgi:hypothetical protein